MNQVAYVIKCNDAVEAIVLDDAELAVVILAQRSSKYYKQNSHAFRDEDEYHRRCHWHLQVLVVTSA